MSGEEKNPASEAAAPQCQFFVQRKKRLCRMTVKPGRHYCGEHEPQPKTEAGQMDKRIPCPNDPKHTVYTSKLLKHLAICNARRTVQPPYIVENINAPEAVDTCPRLPLNSYPKDMLANVVDKINNLYAKHVEGHITSAPSPPWPVHPAVLPESAAAQRAESSRRHLRQVSALLRSAERAALCQPSTCYVELGAGKGQLSYYAAHAWCAGTGSRVLAVDRAPLRHKRDNKLRSAPPTLDTRHNDPHNSIEIAKDVSNDDQHQNDNRINETANDKSNDDLQNCNNHSGNRVDETVNEKVTDDQHQNDYHDNRMKGTANDKSTDDHRQTDNNQSDNRVDEAADEMSADEDDQPQSNKIQSDRNNDYINTENKHNTLKENLDGDPNRMPNEIDKNNVMTNNKNQTVTDQVMKVVDEESRDSSNGENGARPTKSDKEMQNVNDNGEAEAARSVSNSESDVAVRLRADLAHLALEAVPVVAESAAVVGLAKHLCGVATDYALRCVAAPGVVNKTRGLVLATCCHHRIERAPYVANQQLQELGINAEEFNVMLGIVSWATCGDGRSRERRLEDRLGEQELTGETGQEAGSQRDRTQERRATGRRAKALLDWGRVLWLRARGLDARLRHYVAEDVSLENVAIVAVRR